MITIFIIVFLACTLLLINILEIPIDYMFSYKEIYNYLFKKILLTTINSYKTKIKYFCAS